MRFSKMILFDLTNDIPHGSHRVTESV